MQDAHSDLETILQQRAGAFDALARVANHVYGINAKSAQVKWAWDWRTDDLAHEDGNLASFMDDGRWARDTYDVISILRNTIHGEGLETVVHRVHRVGVTYGITPPAEEEMDALVGIAARRGGLARWGIGESRIPLPGYENFILADRFVEALVPDAIRALNALMRLTKVEALPGVDAQSLRKRAPHSRRDMFVNSWTRRRFRLLAGL